MPSRLAAVAVMLWSAAAAAALTTEQQQLLREVHADRRTHTAATAEKSRQGRQLVAKLGRQGDIDAALFLLELGSSMLLMDFVNGGFGAPATPRLEAAVMTRLSDPAFEPCDAAVLIRKYESRALFDALLARIRQRGPEYGWTYCAWAIVRTDLKGIEGDLTALLPDTRGWYEGSGVATLLVERKYFAAERALIDWLLRTESSNAGSAAWIAAKLGTPGIPDALLRRLARMKAEPPGEPLERALTSIAAAIVYATPGVKIDRSLLTPATIAEFPPAYRSKLTEMLEQRATVERMAAETSLENLAYWIRRQRNELVADQMRRGVDPNATGKTAADRPLLIAVNAGNWDAMRMLLDAGADPNIRDGRGNAPLKLVAERKPVAERLEAPALAAAKYLVAKGAQVSAPGEQARTALHGATSQRFKSMVVLLVESGADVNAEASELGISGLTPTLIAEDQKYEELVAYLRSKGGRVSATFVTRRAADRAVNAVLTPFLRGH